MQLIDRLFLSENNFLTKTKTETIISNTPRAGFSFSLEEQKSFLKIVIKDPRGCFFNISKENFFNLLQSLSLEDFSTVQLDIVVDGSNFYLMRVSDPIYLELQFKEKIKLKDCLDKRISFFYQKRKISGIYLGEKYFLLTAIKSTNKKVLYDEFDKFHKIEKELIPFFRNTKKYSFFSKSFDSEIEKKHVVYSEEDGFVFIDKKIDVLEIEEGDDVDYLDLFNSKVKVFFEKKHAYPEFISFRTIKEGFFPFVLNDFVVDVEEEKDKLNKLFFEKFVEEDDSLNIDNFILCEEKNEKPIYLFENFEKCSLDAQDFILDKIVDMSIYFATKQLDTYMTSKLGVNKNKIKDEIKYALFLLKNEHMKTGIRNIPNIITLEKIYITIKDYSRGFFGFSRNIDSIILDILQPICVGRYSQFFK